MYSETVMEHFSNPRNCGKMISADGEGVVGDVRCGDSLTMYIKVKDNKITDIRFLVFGCAASIATSSMTTVLAKGKTLEEALKITEQDIIEALGGLPKIKYHCSNLGVTALRKAIQDYYEKRNKSVFQKGFMFISKYFYSLKSRLLFYLMYHFNKK